MKKVIDYFVITVTMECGEVWETIRHTQEGMGKVVADVINYDEVVRFSVKEIIHTKGSVLNLDDWSVEEYA